MNKELSFKRYLIAAYFILNINFTMSHFGIANYVKHSITYVYLFFMIIIIVNCFFFLIYKDRTTSFGEA